MLKYLTYLLEITQSTEPAQQDRLHCFTTHLISHPYV